eukprot:m.1223043 g.1223043  ORF g.1223043 m.1223043 type:complete len:148 (+) comp24625_c0_seq9:147-590(+)
MCIRASLLPGCWNASRPETPADETAEERALRMRCEHLIRVARAEAPEIPPDHDHVIYIAIDDYTPSDDDEVSLRKGDELLVHRQDEDGWWLCSRFVDGMLGYIPSTLIQSMEAALKENPEQFAGRFGGATVPRFTSVRAAPEKVSML